MDGPLKVAAALGTQRATSRTSLRRQIVDDEVCLAAHLSNKAHSIEPIFTQSQQYRRNQKKNTKQIMQQTRM